MAAEPDAELPSSAEGKGPPVSDADVLMRETFESLRPGPIREAVDGPFREMHAQPASPQDNLGGWARRFGYWSLSA